MDPKRRGNCLRATAEDERAMGKAKTEFHWRAAREFALAACLAGGCMAAGSPAKAQAPSAAQESGSNSRLLSVEEGRAIADAARDQEQPARRARDSFYSLVSTGLEAQDYEGSYWRSRGRPRFYRYIVENTGILSTAKAPASSRSSRSTKQPETEAVIEERSPAASSDSNRPPKTATERTRLVNGPPALPAPASASTTFEVPPSIVIAAGNKQPTSGQVAEAISELSNASGNVLRADDPSKLALPVVIFERLHVERLDIKRNHGWARLQIDSRATLAGGETDYKRRREKVRWELRRTESGWEAITPADRTYVPNDVAVRHLAAKLALLTERDGAAAHQETVLRQESQLANLLSALLEN